MRINILPLLILLLASAACESSGELDFTVAKDFLETPEKVIIDNSHRGSLLIEADCDWRIQKDADWITEISATEGSGSTTISIVCKANDTTAPRSAVLVVSSRTGSVSQRVIVEQTTDPIFTLTKDLLEFSADQASPLSTRLSCNSVWTYSCDAAWCSVDAGTHVNEVVTDIRVSVEPNYLTVRREARITFTRAFDSATLSCTVSQDAATLPVIENASVTDTGKYQLTITARYASMYDITECGIYIGADGGSMPVKVIADASGRSGTMTVTATGLDSGTLYNIQAFVTSPVGTTTSESMPIRTAGDSPDINDNPLPNLPN